MASLNRQASGATTFMFGLARAPDLDRPKLQWLNVERPLRRIDLAGRLVILDFWTACCVNCAHTLPTLRRIEEVYAGQVVVIGINAPKYPAERCLTFLKQALAYHDIRHPVIHDPDLELWQAYGINAWPTLVFVSPDGNVLGHLPGEPCCERLLAGIGQIIRHWRDANGTEPAPLPLLNRSPLVTSPLLFPAQIKALPGDGQTKRWAVADTGHHQIVIFDNDGRELRRFGCRTPGLIDLDDTRSAFTRPHGLIGHGTFLYVADTGNHAIRRIDLATGCVTTVAGTGERGAPLGAPEPARDRSLASVWDLEVEGDVLYFANAGTHQIGALDLKTGQVSRLAGTGEEDLRDGCAARAALAQPSGLALDRTKHILYFTDAETSAVRALHLDTAPSVETLAGLDLFAFGHRNGGFADALFQHCRGVACSDKHIVVADSYNGKIRVMDLARRTVCDLAVGDNTDSAAKLAGSCVSGVACDGDNRLLITATHHHQVMEACLDRGTLRPWAG